MAAYSSILASRTPWTVSLYIRNKRKITFRIKIIFVKTFFKKYVGINLKKNMQDILSGNYETLL